MSEESTAFSDESRIGPRSSPEPTPRHWGVLLSVGAATFLLGVALSVWPGETAAVVAFLLAIHLLTSGVTQLALALAPSHSEQGLARVATALAGAVALVTGVLLLFSPLQTLAFIGWAVGLCVIVVGAADLLGALFSRGSLHRGWQVVRGIVEIAVGLVLVANPHVSLGLLVVLACALLICYGFITMLAALALRSQSRRDHDQPVTD